MLKNIAHFQATSAGLVVAYYLIFIHIYQSELCSPIDSMLVFSTWLLSITIIDWAGFAIANC